MLAGSRRALARVISQVEDGGPASGSLLASLFTRTGRAHVVGVTGAPGTGKSTLVAALAHLCRARGQTVGIVAVDPTSPFSGGALLGDRLRMRDLAGDPGVFIRSMATRGHLGGLAHTTHSIVAVLDAAGFERILVETVGSGQAEVEIASLAHTVIVVEAPGLGDEVQALKAGLLEIADLYVVNKADREGVEQTVAALEAMQSLATAGSPAEGFGSAPAPRMGEGVLHPSQFHSAWQPPILKTVATRGHGIDELLAFVDAHEKYLRTSGRLLQQERRRAAAALDHLVMLQLMSALRACVSPAAWEQAIEAIARREEDPYTAAERLTASLNPPWGQSAPET